MKAKIYCFVAAVIVAPMVFWAYWRSDLVCLPRAIFSSALFGVVPLLALLAALKWKHEILYHLTFLVFIIEMVATPLIMLHRLGWEKFAGERLLAFFTFEGFALLEIVLVFSIYRGIYLSKRY